MNFDSLSNHVIGAALKVHSALGPGLFEEVYKVCLRHELTKNGIKVRVINSPSIKPLDEATILRAAINAGCLVTVEEHQIHGGMGSAVAECLAKNFPVPIEFIGVNDKFGQSGKPDELIEFYGMGEKHIYEAAIKVMVRK